MKKIVMLTCPRAETVCTGAGCFSALNGRTHRFREYGDEELQVSAFMKCSGCGHFPRQDKGLDEKNREDSGNTSGRSSFGNLLLQRRGK